MSTLQIKSWTLWAIMTASALAMNLTRFEYRYALFPLMLLIFPAIGDKNFNYRQFLSPQKQGLKLFIILIAVVYIFYPPLFFGYFSLFLHKTIAIASFDSILSALNKGVMMLIIVALPEEIFFRAFFQQTVFVKYDRKLFWLVSQKNFYTSLLFGITHAIAFLDISRAATFFPSLLFGLIVEKSGGRIFYSVLFHGLANILAFILMTFIAGK